LSKGQRIVAEWSALRELVLRESSILSLAFLGAVVAMIVVSPRCFGRSTAATLFRAEGR